MTASLGAVPATGWLARYERFDSVGSTNDVVMGWLRDGAPEVCVAIADEQTAGRGRSGRAWTAPAGACVLLSAGFRPTWLGPEHAWRLGAVVALAMAVAADEVSGLRPGTVRLKWPNDLVLSDPATGAVLKLCGLLGETAGLGTDDPQAVVGLGVNVNWERAMFPAELVGAMTSLSEAAGQQIGRDALEAAFLDRLGPLVTDLRAGNFPAGHWRERQLTNGMQVRLEWPDGAIETLTALDVDPESGALLVESAAGERAPRAVLVGEIRHLRVGGVT